MDTMNSDLKGKSILITGASTGIGAFYYIASGMFDTVLAVTGDKLSESPVQLGLSTVYDPILGRQFACGAPSAGGGPGSARPGRRR